METLADDILLRYLSATASDQEVASVETWLAQSTENEKLLEQLYFTWQVTNKLKVMKGVNPEMGLVSLKRQIRQKEKDLRIRHYFQLAQRVAAILFIPFLLLSIFLLTKQEENAERYVEVTTNPGMVSKFELPDGSQVWMNGGSYLKYPIKFASAKREIILKGQGYFQVTHNPDKPFIVKAGNRYSVKVLGTEFNLTAYKNEDKIETTLVKGSVELNIQCSADKTIRRVLVPDEKAIFDKNNNTLSIHAVNPQYDTAWKEGKIIFKRHPMEEVLQILSRHYNVHFRIKNPEVKQSVITANFSNEPLRQVLEYLELASGIKFKVLHPDRIEDNTLKVSEIEIYK